MNGEISKAGLNDIEALNLLINSAYRGESSKKGWTTEADFLDGIRIDADDLKEIISRRDSQMLKYVNEKNRITGCVHLEKKREKLYLGMLTVSPELQNKGTGKLLLNAAEEEARKLNCKSIYMTVITLRTELIAWYERRGYTNTQVKKPFPMGDPAFGLPKRFLEFVVLEKILV